MISASQNQNPFPSGSTTHSQTMTSSTANPPRSRSTSLHQRPAGAELANLTNTPESRNLSLKSSYRGMAVAELITVDNLPEVPDDLKTHVAAYIQRARELATKDPVMCYWCTSLHLVILSPLTHVLLQAYTLRRSEESEPGLVDLGCSS